MGFKVKNKIVSFFMILIIIIIFGIFIYPGIYKYDKLDQKYPVKINRFTSETMVLKKDYWYRVGSD